MRSAVAVIICVGSGSVVLKRRALRERYEAMEYCSARGFALDVFILKCDEYFLITHSLHSYYSHFEKW